MALIKYDSLDIRSIGNDENRVILSVIGYDIKTSEDEEYCQQLLADINIANNAAGAYAVRLDHMILKEISFSGKELTNIIAYDCVFVGCDFRESIIIGCSFFNCKFYNCSFDGCRSATSDSVYRHRFGCPSGVSLFGCRLDTSTFINANLIEFKFRACRFGMHCSFQNATFANKYIAIYNSTFDADLLGDFKETVAREPYYPQRCPDEGSFIGWKKASIPISTTENHFVLIKLLVPEDAKRSSGFSYKIRVSKAKVLGIYDYDEETFEISKLPETVKAMSCYCIEKDALEYTVGKMMHSNSFDENRWNECSYGIHLFLTREEAIMY